MKKETKQLGPYITEAFITIEKAQVDKEKAALARQVNLKRPLPGFRPGHAPANLVAESYGLMEFNREVANTLVREAVVDFVLEAKLNPVVDPKVELTKFEDELSFKVTITTRPEVKVGNYEKLKAKKPEPKEVKDAEVDKIIQDLYEKSNFGSTQVDPESGEKFLLDAKGQKVMLGKAKQGKLDDNFALQFGLKNLQELEDKIRQNLVVERERQAESEAETKLLEELVKITKVDLPQTLVEVEVEAMISRLENQVYNLGGNFEDYLKEQKKTREDLARDFTPNAQRTLTASLALDEIAKEKNIKISPDQVKLQMPPEHAEHKDQGVEEELVRVQLVRREALSRLKKLASS